MGSDHYRALFTLGILLFLVTFVINLTADLVVRGVRRTLGHVRRHRRSTPRNRTPPERSFALLFLLMTVLLILPVLIILGVLVVKGGPAIIADFLFTEPTNGMTAGGIFPALVGTIWLVAVALLASVPLGVAAAIYLSEYAPDNWLTRAINLAIINLAGVPSIVHALFGVGAFVLFFRFGTSILAASLTLAIMTPARRDRGDARVAAGRAAGLPRGLLEHGRHALADDPHGRAAQLRSAAS